DQLNLLIERNEQVERELAALGNTFKETIQQYTVERTDLRKQLDSVKTVSICIQ
ncbi:unnamed protein product, partial [Trichobilharzia regenti]